MDLPSDSGGYIRLHRCFLEHPIWTSCSRHVREVGLVCVLRANWKDGRWWNNHRRELIEVKRSQWATSIEKIQQACPKGTSTKQVRTAIVTLEKLGFLGKQTGKGFTLITICNYDKWNPPGSENGNQSGAARARQGQDKGKTRATIEEGKEGEEGKKVKKKSSKDKILSVVGEEFRAYWNGKDCLPEIRTWDEGREQALMERRNNPDFCEHWREAIDALTRSAFHTGQNDSRWAADVDWFLGGVKKGANWKKCWEKESRLGHGAKQISPGVAQWLINKKGAQGNEPKQP